ncbi:GNAT family N-acetyltransferase [Paenibacillus marinisediminis]
MKMVCETERLQLRVFEETDREAAASFWGDDEVMKYCLGATPLELLPKVLAGYIACDEKLGLSVYAVVEKVSGTVIGACGFNVTEGVEEIELIYHYAKTSWGKGYATEAATACVQLAKADGRVRRIHASADPSNAASFKTLEKAGFTSAGMEWFEDTGQEEPVYEYIIPKL